MQTLSSFHLSSSWKQCLVLCLVSSFLFVGCGSTQPVTNAPTENKQAVRPTRAPALPAPELTDEQQQELDAGKQADEKKALTFHVKGGLFYYVPNEIMVKKGDKVKIIFESIDGMHNFVLDAFGVKTIIIRKGEHIEAEFVADKVGSFEYHCGVGQHRVNGQKGTFTVTN